MRKIIPIILIFLLSACQSTEPIAPEHIKYDNENITWDEIEDASSYQVIINDETYTLYDNTFDVSYLDDGTYDIIIFAIYDDDKQASSHFAFTITREYEAPTNLRFSHPILSFDSQRPTSYELYIDDELITTFDSTTIDISSYIEDNQVYEIKIHAIYNDEHYISDVFVLDTHNKLDLDKELTYILRSSTELIFTFDELEEVSYILYDDEILDVELYELKDNTLIFSKDIFFYPSYGDNIFEIHTEEGYFFIKINVQELEKPHLYSSSTIYYESQTDIQLEFKLLGGSFVKLGGNDITDDDYYYQDPILTIKTSYIEDIITNNPDRKTIILSYQLEKNEDSYTGLIFIYIE